MPPRRLLELADAARDRAGERALLVAEQLGFEQVLGDRGAIDRDERRARAVRFRVHEARQHLLAGAGLAGDQHRGIARRDLLREPDHLRHRVVAIDEVAVIVGDRRKHGGDQFGIGRQRDVFFRARMDRGHGRARVGRGAAGDHRHGDVLGFEPRDQIADVDRDLDHQQVGAAAGAQHAQRHLGAIGMRDGRALFHGEFGGERELPAQRSDDQEAHRLRSFSVSESGQVRSALIISVMVTPSFSSTSTTSPRATSRLLM